MNRYAIEASGLGEAFHTAFRKATECKESADIWKLIDDMPAKDWHNVLAFVYDCLPPRVQEAMDEEGRQMTSRLNLDAS